MIASTNIDSLLKLIETVGVSDLKYFEMTSESLLRKMLLLKAKNSIQDVRITNRLNYRYIQDWSSCVICKCYDNDKEIRNNSKKVRHLPLIVYPNIKTVKIYQNSLKSL